MIESIKFEHFRNLDERTFYLNNDICNYIFGKNNSGKSNLIDGIMLAFSTITDSFFKIEKTDFTDCKDDLPITITVNLSNKNPIKSLRYEVSQNTFKYGFIVNVFKVKEGKYRKQVLLGNGAYIDHETLDAEDMIPNVCKIPLIRIEDIYSTDLSAKITKFIENEENYSKILSETKIKINEEMKQKRTEFQNFCQKFNHDMDVELSNPKIGNQKLYVVEGTKEFRDKIGSGYKSIANIILNSMDENYNIILIDEVENHLHPPMLRVLIRELRELCKKNNIQIIATTHSPIIINEARIEELISIDGVSLLTLDNNIKNKLNMFLTSERSELIFADNIVLVEGYTEQLILNYYLRTKNNYNWTIVNAAGVMFEPYIELATLLQKKIVVISDDDQIQTEDASPTQRFKNLSDLCTKKDVKIFKVENTLETDLFNKGILDNDNFGSLLFLKKSKKNNKTYYVAKEHMKTIIAEMIIELNIDLSKWNIIRGIEDEFNSI